MTQRHDIPNPRPVPSKDPARLSKTEQIKDASLGLRGSLAGQLEQDTTQFTGSDPQLLKFHGVYQQDDRDARRAARETAGGKRHMMMVRSKVPGGVLTADQYLAQDDLCARYGNGTLRITTRQDFQFHGVLKRNLKATIRALNDALTTTFGACGDVVRNVIACPEPASDPVRAEIVARAQAISDRFLPATRAYFEIWLDGEQVASGEPEPDETYGRTYLPRKFKIALAPPGDNCIDVYSNDIGIVPVVENGALTGFNVMAGGGLGMTHGMETTFPRVADPICFVEPDDLTPVVEAILGVFRDHGNRADRKRARLKYVVETWGVDAFRDELSARMGRPLAPALPMSWENAADHLGWHEQGDGTWYLGLYIENGRIADTDEARQRSGLRAAVERFHPGIRLTPQQNIILAGIAAGDRAEVEAILRAHGVRLPLELLPVRRSAMACPALPTCGLALAEAERVLPNAMDQIEALLNDLGLGDEQFSVRMTGCPNGCARPYLGDVGIVGRTLGKYNIYLGGDFHGTRLNTEFAELVPFDEIARTLRPVLIAFRAERRLGEGFGDFCHRTGTERLRAIAGLDPVPA
jgi:sulfite reductase (ferredoxin)